MPVQQQNASFASKLGGRIAQANAEHKDKPIDTGNRRLPPGIRSGVAKLSTLYTKEQTEDGAKTPKGQVFFRASAIVLGELVNGVLQETFRGQKIAGMVTSQIIPLCDVPAKGKSKAETFSENWFEFQNIIKLLSGGAVVCQETERTDPTGQKTEAFFMAAMQHLLNQNRTKPILIEFSTRGWRPPKAPGQVEENEEMTFETWHGLAQWDGKVDPAAGVGNSQPPTQTSGPGVAPPAPPTQTAPTRSPAPPSQNGPPPQHQPEEPMGDDERAELVQSLVEVAMSDPNGETEEGAAASEQLENMAWAAGWTKDQTKDAADWAHVGEMALNPPTAEATPPPASTPPAQMPVAVGTRWNFQKRIKDGSKLKNGKGEEFPPQQVEVVTVDAATKTCTVKTVKDGKPVVDIKSKQPVQVRWEWLDPTIPY